MIFFSKIVNINNMIIPNLKVIEYFDCPKKKTSKKNTE